MTSYSIDFSSSLSTSQNTNKVVLTDFSQITAPSNFYLPSASTITIYADIKDSEGCITTVYQNVSMTITNQTPLQSLSRTLDFLSNAKNNGITNAMNVLADQITLIDNQFSSGGGSGCQNSCSQHGTCVQNQCQCSKDYYLADCSMNSEDYAKQLSVRQSLIDEATTQISNANDPAELEMALNLLQALTNNSDLNNNQTLSTALDAVNSAVDVMNTFNESTNLTTSIQECAEILSDILNEVNSDCGLSTNFSSIAINSTYALLGNLSDLLLRNATAEDGSKVIITENFVTYSQNVHPSQLNNLTIDTGMSSSPSLQLGDVQNIESLPSLITVEYIYLRYDPLRCDKTPSQNVTVQFKDASTRQPVTVVTSVKVTYPKETFPDVTCEEECSKSTDSSGNVACECDDISIFDIKNQLAYLYNNSNLKHLTIANIKLAFSADIIRRWSFWVMVGYTVVLIYALAFVNTINKNYCLITKIKARRKRKEPVGFCITLALYLLVPHPLFGMFMIVDKDITKTKRLFIYYMRVMCLLAFSAVFTPTDIEDFVKKIPFFSN